MALKVVNCPQCGTGVEWKPENRFRPFCSERCKLMDLGAWATERYRVPVADSDDPALPREDDEAPRPS
jgi:endogenous inhibitor of DNA gyrase (YacG/DUF329 family)